MAKIYFKNEDCIDVMKRQAATDYKVDIILTSPPYSTSRSTVKTQKAIDTYNRRYDICLDNMNQYEYRDWTVELFKLFDGILAKDGVVLYNISYGNENPDTLWLAIGSIIEQTNFTVGDCIVWKKSSALPNNVSKNKMTRITEFVFVLCRKDEFMTYRANKKVKTKREDTGQLYFENMFNFIEAPNNDGACDLNKATYSTALCEALLEIYATDGCKVMDPFMGTGTTAIAVEKFAAERGFDMTCIGCELSVAQVEFSKKRLDNFRKSGKTMIKQQPKPKDKKKKEEQKNKNNGDKATE